MTPDTNSDPGYSEGQNKLAVKSLQHQVDHLRKLLHDVDQCAPADLNLLRDAGEDLRWALQAVRDEMEK